MCFVSNTSECVCVKYLSFLLVLPRILIYDILCLYRLVVEHSWCKACSEIQKIPNKKIFSCCTVILDITQRGSTPRSTLCTFSFTSEETWVNCRNHYDAALHLVTMNFFVLVWNYVTSAGFLMVVLLCAWHHIYWSTLYFENYWKIELKTISPGIVISCSTHMYFINRYPQLNNIIFRFFNFHVPKIIQRVSVSDHTWTHTHARAHTHTHTGFWKYSN